MVISYWSGEVKVARVWNYHVIFTAVDPQKRVAGLHRGVLVCTVRLHILTKNRGVLHRETGESSLLFLVI